MSAKSFSEVPNTEWLVRTDSGGLIGLIGLRCMTKQ